MLACGARAGSPGGGGKGSAGTQSWSSNVAGTAAPYRDLQTSQARQIIFLIFRLTPGVWRCLSRPLKVVPIHAELTTQEAADLLNVSRPHLVKLLEEGVLPFHRAGKHRRVRFADLMSFKGRRDQASEHAMAELAKQAQELRMGYE